MNYEEDRFGSARPASMQDLKRAGLLDGKGISFGFDQTKRHELRSPTDGSVALMGGAGCGKSASAFANPLIGGHLQGNFICFSPRGELEAVSILSLSLQGYSIFFCNSTGMLGLPRHQFNPWDHLRLDSPSLIADAEKTALDLCPTPPGTKSSWSFEDARRWACEFILYDSERCGCASMTGVYELILGIQGDLDVWCQHLERMMNSRFQSVRGFASEIMALQKQGKDSFTAPLSVLQNAFSFMRDPRVAWTFGGSDFSLQWLTNPNRKIAVFVTWPIEYLQTQGSAIRQVLGGAIQYKLRNPSPHPVSILIDEAGQLGNFNSVRELFTFGRGAGLVGNMVAWQEVSQIRAAFGPQADEILGSAQYRVYKGVRTLSSGHEVSAMAGSMTLDYDAQIEQSNARRMKQHAAMKMLSGGSMFEAMADMRHYAEAQENKTKQGRELFKPEEVLNLGKTEMIAFASGLVQGPIHGHWINHFEREDFAGLYLNNPYHSEDVSIKTRWGSKRACVIEETVPAALERLPQYQGGTWRYVEGYRPQL